MKSPNPPTLGNLPASVLPSKIRPDQRGSALIITLMFVVLATILVIGFAEQIRLERASAKSYLERARAEQFARMGLDSAKGILARYTGNSSEVWASQPGALMVPATAGNRTLSLSVPLHSGNSSLSPNASAVESQAAELNIPMLADNGARLITDDVASLPLRWIYVREDGTLDTAEPPALNLTNTANPLVGRFAFWVDDESSKINLNIAWRRGGSNPYPQSHPTSLSLSAISENVTPTMVDDLHTAITGSSTGNYSVIDRFLNSPGEVGSVPGSSGPDWAEAIRESKFQVTHYNHDPGTTFFGKPRIVLTTQQRYAPRDGNGTLMTTTENATITWTAGDGTTMTSNMTVTSPYFLDILTNSGTATARGADPGTLAAIDAAKYTNTVFLLVAYMQKNNWPMVSGNGSIQSKYYGSDTARLAQLAVNIIEYVRSAESAEPVIEMMRTAWNGSTFINDRNGATWNRDGNFQGIGRVPFLTEVGFARDLNDTVTIAGKTYFRCSFFREVHLPKDWGMDEFDLLQPRPGENLFVNLPTVQRSDIPTSGSTAVAGASPFRYWRNTNRENQNGVPVGLESVNAVNYLRVYPNDIRDESGNVASSKMLPGEYRVIRKDFWVDTAFQNSFVEGNKISVSGALSSSTSVGPGTNPGDSFYKLAHAQLIAPLPVPHPSAPTTAFMVALGGNGTSYASASTLQTDDPRNNAIQADWKVAPQTLGKRNTGVRTDGTLTKSPNATTQAPQDTDSSGKISSASLRMAYPRGHAKNKDGVVQSVGELGLIHTGIEGNSTLTGNSVPWRTLRLQPTPAKPTSVVPDWAFMDLFTVPTAVPTAAARIFTPYGSHVAGRINVNSKSEPFGNSAVMGNGTLTRIAPLRALLTSVTKTSTGNATLSEAEATTIATNIYNRTLSSKGKTYGFVDGYDSPGEIAEIEGVADGGEETEEVIRGIANLISARGSVFTVYTIGQSLKQTTADKLLITAEQRQQVMLEGYPDTASTTKYRPVSVRTLSP